MNNKLIIHIGSPKTGSTSIQKFFFENRKQLTEYGIVYPVFKKNSMSEHHNAHFLFYKAIIDLDRDFDLRTIFSKQETIEVIEDNYSMFKRKSFKQNIVFISDEFLYELFVGMWFNDPQLAIVSFKNLLYQLDFREIEILLYLRDKTELLYKRYCTGVSTGYKYSLPVFYEEVGRKLIDYSSLVENLIFILKDFKINIRFYNKDEFKEGNILNDLFGNVFNICLDDCFNINVFEKQTK